MKKSVMYGIVAVVIIIIIIGVVAAVLLMQQGGGGTNTPTATPTATATASVGNATTLSFTANITSGGSTIEYKWQGTNVHSANVTARTDFSTYAYILNASAEKSWASTDSGKTFTASDFKTDWPVFGLQWSESVDALTAHWNGTSYTFTDTLGETVTLSNVVVNPTIPDSTFAVS